MPRPKSQRPKSAKPRPASKTALPALLFSTPDGQLLEHPHLSMAAHNGVDFVVPRTAQLTPIPPNWDILQLPDTFPVGFDAATGKFEVVEKVPGLRGVVPRAAAIHPPPGFVRQYLPGAHYLPFNAPTHKPLNVVDEGGMQGRSGLPLWAYTAVGWAQGGVMAGMFQGDEVSRWHPTLFYKKELPGLVEQRLALDPNNPVLLQLKECAVDYKCCCAQNVFYGRWEAAIPMAPACNAACLGCISKDAEWDAPTPQKRLKFSPDGPSIGRVISHHLLTAPEPMASFGQGCEGEPTLSAQALVDGVAAARRTAKKGIIHLNTNGSKPGVVAQAAAAGINSVRVSVNTFDEAVYEAYYRPKDYKLSALEETLTVARDAGLYKCINLLLWPGWTDTPAELERLSQLVAAGKLDMIQLRNLCVDPAYYNKILPAQREKPMGLRAFVDELHRRFPKLRFGTFNPRLAAPWFEQVKPWVGAAVQP